MKSFFPLACLLACAAPASAQLQQGNLMVGASVGSINFSSFGNGGGSAFNIGLSPRLGYFVSDQAVVGASLSAGYYRSEGSSSLGLGAFPFLRYFLSAPPAGGVGRSAPFVEVGLGYQWARTSVEVPGAPNIVNSGGDEAAYLSGGLDYFVTPSVALEGALTYGYKTGFGRHNVGVSLGFQIFLGRGDLFGKKSGGSAFTAPAREEAPPPPARPSTTPRTSPSTSPKTTTTPPQTKPRSGTTTTPPRSGTGTTPRRTTPAPRTAPKNR